MENIPYSRQNIQPSDIEAVSNVLGSDWITQGPKVQEFEQALADYCGAKYAVAVSSGTAALHLAGLAAGLTKGDQAITTPITFLATANAILYAGAEPVFADIDYESVNIDLVAIKKAFHPKTKAIVTVDFAGLPAAMPEIYQFAKQKNLIVIEDASHSLGATYGGGGKVGSCRFADMTIFSFHPVKHLTTGEGGCITTNNKTYYEKLKSLRAHGVERSESMQARAGGWYYEMTDLGFNYRITDFQCALGLSQLKRLEDFLAKREQLAKKYDQALSSLKDKIKIPAQQIQGERHARHLYLLRLKDPQGGKIRRGLYDYLKAEGVHAQVHYIPIYQQPFYRKKLHGKKINCPQAERYYEEVLSLPLFPDLQEAQVQKIAQLIKDFFGGSSLLRRPSGLAMTNFVHHP